MLECVLELFLVQYMCIMGLLFFDSGPKLNQSDWEQACVLGNTTANVNGEGWKQLYFETSVCL